MYSVPDQAAAEIQIAQMEEDYEKARSLNKPVHPGFHAHLGYLYYQVGKVAQVEKEFIMEKKQIPESAVIMDLLITRLGKGKP
jgi:hypothetical protein